MKQYQADLMFPEQQTKKSSFTSAVSSTRRFDWNLESTDIWTDCSTALN